VEGRGRVPSQRKNEVGIVIREDPHVIARLISNVFGNSDFYVTARAIRGRAMQLPVYHHLAYQGILDVMGPVKVEKTISRGYRQCI